MNTFSLVRMFKDLEAAGVSEVERVSYDGPTSPNPASPRVTVGVSLSIWRSVMDDTFYRTGSLPRVYASLMHGGQAVYLSAEVRVGQLHLTTSAPLESFGEVDQLLLAAGVDERKVRAWATLGGAL